MEVVKAFPFHKLRYFKYITIEVLLFIELSDALKFMFGLNKSSRLFIEQRYFNLRNGFINEGLIPN